MFKFFILGVFLRLEVSGKIVVHKISINPMESELTNQFEVENPEFYVRRPQVVIHRPAPKQVVKYGKQVRPDYVVTKGIGAYKLHFRKLTWNKARRVCHEEGGHLAIIRSAAEENVLKRMMFKHRLQHAWIGFHDAFEEGDWVSVLDEPLATIGWNAWSKTPDRKNPDNWLGIENCAEFLPYKGGMNDRACSFELVYICKIPL